ncbi:MAG: hypothetical protein A2V70_17560 [Planctomycetes bacterium RBG_13_63_9]|nr:MAG: hypothetical protein A2V70_17560 [Planctomycetes bacterium RBG_13_63_9]
MIRQGVAEGRPYAVAFVGSHMPLGWNGAETIAHIREEFPRLQIILCADPSDSTVAGLLTQFGGDERLLIMKRPLGAVELRQLAEAITRRWGAERESSQYTTALEEARHTAESANRAKSQFISNMSHEIRTPMNAILGFSRSLMNDPLAPHQLEKLHYIHDSGKTLLRLIDDVIDFSQLSAGVLVLKPVDFDLDALVQDVLAGSASVAREKNLTVEYYADASLPRWLYGDQKRLRQVLRNLIDNAIKFTEQGTVEVRTRLETARDQSVALRLTVSDTGVGIREDHQTMVFDPFYQVDGSETRRFEGVGLGLAICKQIVHLMGGYIGVHSVLGEGSTFWVALAFQQSATGKNDQAAHPPGSPSEPTSVFGAAPATAEPFEVPRTPEECLRSMRAALATEDYCLLESCAQTLRDQAAQQAWRSVSRHALQAIIAARNGDRERITAAIGKLENTLQECRETVTGAERVAT